jgi:hypothetical protein
MLRRSFACALVLAAAAFAAPAVARAPLSSTQSGWKVEVRKPGTAVWAESGRYASSEAARGAAAWMFGAGLQVRVTRYTEVTMRHPTAPLPDGPAPAYPWPKPAPPKTPAYPAAIPAAQAGDVFRKMEAMGDRLAFRFPTDGCYARAHLMMEEMRKQGLQPWKVWSKQNGREPLYVTTTNHPRKYVTWGWHVAPVLRVRLKTGKVYWVVFDPSLFRQPCFIPVWQKKQKRPGAKVSPVIEVTPPGRAPVWEGKRTGTGYTVKDNIPPALMTTLAWAKMREYKPSEGKWHPKLDKDCPAWAKVVPPAGPAPKPTPWVWPKTGVAGAGPRPGPWVWPKTGLGGAV